MVKYFLLWRRKASYGEIDVDLRKYKYAYPLLPVWRLVMSGTKWSAALACWLLRSRDAWEKGLETNGFWHHMAVLCTRSHDSRLASSN
jgi:hypothetical protein